MTTTVLKVTAREKTGKGAIRSNRLKGLIPGVVYGDKKAPVMITLGEKELVMEMRKPGFWVRKFELDLDGKKHHVICQAVQSHPVTDRPEHVDFLRISKDSVLTLNIPVHVQNEETCAGIKLGGVLNLVHREIEVSCPADKIVDAFVFDLEPLNIGDVVTLADLKIPAGITPSLADDETILSITPPQSEVKEEAPAAATEEAPATDATADK